MSKANEEKTKGCDTRGVMVQISEVGMVGWDNWTFVVSPLRTISCAGSKGRGFDSIILIDLDPVGG